MLKGLPEVLIVLRCDQEFPFCPATFHQGANEVRFPPMSRPTLQ